MALSVRFKEKLLKLFTGVLPDSVVRYLETTAIERATAGMNESYSQEGEDLVVNRFFGKRPPGFFVDVGAHHPYWYSNTYKFYKMGWRGINIDALPGTKALFDALRPRDINLEIPVALRDGQEMVYYMFNDPALNTFVESEAALKDNLEKYQIINKVRLRTRTLSGILDDYLPSNTGIDFMSIDVEGLDLEVLQSNDWLRFRPSLILVEELRTELHTPGLSSVRDFLNKVGYTLFARTINTSFFKDERADR